GTELWVADLGDNLDVGNRELVAGGETESVFQPEWSPAGVLHFVSDRSGWWNLYRWEDGGPRPLAPRDEEFGLPAWEFGSSTYCFMHDGRIACVHGLAEDPHLGLLDPDKGTIDDLDLPFTYFGSHLATDGRRLAFAGATPTEPVALIQLDPADGSYRVLRSSHRERLDPGYISVPQPIEFPTENGRTAHALFYPPANRDARGPEGELPPLVTLSHGGPTAHSSVRFGLDIQFWTSRGFAVVDVNYGGSTGYGRDYRERLRGQWGIVDVADCVNAAKHLAAQGLADGGRMAIRGGSAGGYVTLCAITFHDAFTAAASYFGIGDLETFVKDTHKFESRYCDGLIGPFPEAIEVYRERSPIHFLDRITSPVILLQGLEDAIVPPSQAEQMVAALDARGLPYAYVAFQGEQHGFRKAESIQRSIEAELYFYSRLWGFEPADRIEPVPIQNLPDGRSPR
ncbi:MAG TPA: S9 family peptidase, partial [Actinomycetota bacterium]